MMQSTFEVLPTGRYNEKEKEEKLELLAAAENLITRYAANLLAAIEILDRNNLKHRLDTEMTGFATVEVLAGLSVLKILTEGE